MHLRKFTLQDYETEFADRHLLQDVLAKWAKEKSEAPAILSGDGSRTVTWSEFDNGTWALAGELLRLGFSKGDYLVTFLPLSVDHVLFEYACFKIGVIVAPLDLRLPSAEVIRMLEILRPRGFACLGANDRFDHSEMRREVQAQCRWLQHFLTLDSPGAALDAPSFPAAPGSPWRSLTGANRETDANSAAPLQGAPIVTENDGALVIFTTGSTGSPKPALLSHRNITVQNMCIGGAILGGDQGLRALVHLPPSHVGCQTELMMSTFFGGGSVVLLDAFEATRALRAIEQHRVEIFAQIPAMFNLVWMLKDFDRYDLSSVKIVAFGGNSVSRPFVERVAAMAPVVGTGLGLTECAGFCTYVLAEKDDLEPIVAGLGEDMPVYPCAIRRPMRDDGFAGGELPSGEIGHICFRGPQTFLGYVNDPDATAKTISRDGFLYTGDLGYKNASGLHLTGREKWVIKSFGHQIFPGDVEAHVSTLFEKVANCVVVGVEHEFVSEAPVALVEKKPGAELSTTELDRHARSLPPYMRPRHWIILECGSMPLNRVAKPDHLRALEMARHEIARLRARGEWDRSLAGSQQNRAGKEND